jgi:hypothetical protein
VSASSPIYAFVHIPFSAGTTVRNAILASHSADEVFDCYGWRRTSAVIADEIRALSPARRDRVKFLLGHQVWFGIDELFDREVRYFTFLRNPISRTVSAYWKIQRDERNFYHDAVRSMTLEQFAQDLPICRNHATVMLARETVDDGHNFATCVDEDESMLARARANLDRCWFTGLYETFSEDFAELSATLGLPAVAPANVRPAAQDQEHGPAPADSHAIARHNMMDFCLYSTVQIKREREAAQLMRAQSA